MDRPFRVNLSSPDWRSPAIEVNAATRFALDVNPSAWGSAVVEVQTTLSMEPDPVDGTPLVNWRSFSTAVELDATTPFVLNQYAPPGSWLSVIVTTADAAADDDAPAVLKLQP